jgi:hypothetical protein
MHCPHASVILSAIVDWGNVHGGRAVRVTRPLTRRGSLMRCRMLSRSGRIVLPPLLVPHADCRADQPEFARKK